MDRAKMRRTDRSLSKEEAEEILRKSQYGVLSTVCADGYPYGVPMSYAWYDGKLYFHHTVESSLLGENILGEVKACFTVVGNTQVLPAKFSTEYESVIVFGRIKESGDKLVGLMKLVEKFSPDYLEQGERYARASADRVKVYEFEIEQVTGKARRAK